MPWSEESNCPPHNAKLVPTLLGTRLEEFQGLLEEAVFSSILLLTSGSILEKGDTL